MYNYHQELFHLRFSLTLKAIMFYVYVLKSMRDSSLHIEFAPDLRARMQKHLNGLVPSTKNIRPLDLIYYESKKRCLNERKTLKTSQKGFLH